MNTNKAWWACGLAILGCLQAWDSGVLKAGSAVQVLVALAILAPAAALVGSSSYRAHAASVAVSLGLLTVARMISPVPLNTLHFIGVMAALLVFGAKLVRPTLPAV